MYMFSRKKIKIINVFQSIVFLLLLFLLPFNKPFSCCCSFFSSINSFSSCSSFFSFCYSFFFLLLLTSFPPISILILLPSLGFPLFPTFLDSFFFHFTLSTFPSVPLFIHQLIHQLYFFSDKSSTSTFFFFLFFSFNHTINDIVYTAQ